MKTNQKAAGGFLIAHFNCWHEKYGARNHRPLPLLISALQTEDTEPVHHREKHYDTSICHHLPILWISKGRNDAH